MAVVRVKYRKRIIISLLCLIFAVIFVTNRVATNQVVKRNLAYTKIVDLPAPFVRLCQKAAVDDNINWELLAAFFQIEKEYGLIKTYPSADVINAVARKLKSVSNDMVEKRIIQEFGSQKNLARDINERTKTLHLASILYSANYAFPYQDKVYYTDTWGAAREGGKRVHEGTDLFAPEGTPVYAISNGEVEKLGWNRLGGERVGIRGQDTIYYYYAHLCKINPALKMNMTISKGTLIGYTGHTGDAITTPDHLHFGMELTNGTWVNPYNLLGYWQENQPR